MVARPCLRNLDKPIVALWGLEPVDLFLILGVAGGILILSNIGMAVGGGLLACLALKALKAGKPRGYVFGLCYRAGLLRFCPEGLRPPYLVIPPTFTARTLRLSAAPGPEDDRTPEARFFRAGKRYLT